MEDNEARFSEAEHGLLADSLEEWLSKSDILRSDLQEQLCDSFQAHRPRRSIPTILLKLTNYTIKLQMINYFYHWTSNDIIKHEKKKAIHAYIKYKYSVTTSREYISYYQEGLTAIKARMSAGDLKKYDELADKWNATALPAELQRDRAEKHCVKYIKEFARQIYRQLGMRVEWIDADWAENQTTDGFGDYKHDYNEENGSISFIKTQTDWESRNIMQKWGAYATKAFGQANTDADVEQVDTGNKKGKKPLLALAFADDGQKARQAEDEELVVFKGYRTTDSGVALTHKEPGKKTTMVKAKDNMKKSMNNSQARIKQWEITIQQQLEHPLMIEPNVAPAEVGIDHDISKYSFLLNVSSRSEYRDMLTAIYGREQAEDSLRPTILVAEWCSWSYTSAFLPEVVHNTEDSQEAFFLWLFESAYLNDKGKVVSKDHLWQIILAIGFLLNDIHQRQFSRPDPDGPDTGCVEGTPSYVLQSDIDFTKGQYDGH
ncbi:hypothetical protein EW146_g6495 [Bondarzewia mesenterica]|uniref:Uncharacterized protein n=1 Tax=Bondarzewia mesenterica TaxID=1095465 RepID=A0A4S4LNE2_9AGAM|nr:hypothetical protein EW146_g6495 [Bondarzewia mesenterica]